MLILPQNFIRQKTIYCGYLYREIDIFPYTEHQKHTARTGKRSKKEKVSAPKQKNLNDKNAKRYLIQLANTNFGENDLYITNTYSKKYLPETIEEAEKEITNYIQRISYHMKQQGLPPLKYILVTSYSTGKNGDKPTRIHHHLLINGGLDRDFIENLWRKRKKKGQKKGDKIGTVNARRLQPNEGGITAVATYLAQQVRGDIKGKKRWRSSQNLKRPESRTNDSKYSHRQIEKICKAHPSREFWEKKYPGWTITNEDYGAEYVYNEITGWSIYLKLRKKE